MHPLQAASAVVGVQLGHSDPIAFQIGRWLLMVAGALFLVYLAVLAVLVGISAIRHTDAPAGRMSHE
jgi:hypothetical protein